MRIPEIRVDGLQLVLLPYISAKSTTGGFPVMRALASIRERASVTTFSEP